MLGSETYEVLAVVPYLQVAFSLVVRDIVVWVVPEESVPEGAPLLLVGGVVSAGWIVKEDVFSSAQQLLAVPVLEMHLAV